MTENGQILNLILTVLTERMLNQCDLAKGVGFYGNDRIGEVIRRQIINSSGNRHLTSGLCQ